MKLAIGLNSNAKVFHIIETYGQNKTDLKNVFEMEIWFYLNYEKKHKENYSQEKSEEYYLTQIKQLTEDVEYIKDINIETDITVNITHGPSSETSYINGVQHTRSINNTIYRGVSCADAVEAICNKVNELSYSN